jgi:phosphatidate cytidylyltransferase
MIVAESNPAPVSRKPRPSPSNISLRIISAVVLAPLAIGAAWFGGLAFSLFWGLAAFGVWWEWSTLVAVSAARLVMFTGVGALGLALALSATGRYLAAVIVILLGAAATNVVAPAGRGAWVSAGVIYSGSLLVAPLILRHHAQWGFIAVILLFGVVWATDIVAYVAGRTLNGPKLWPAVSPNKTVAGALSGACAAMIVGWILARTVSPHDTLHLIVVALALSIAAQGGDLFESSVKRRFSVKDTSQLIPGHGGLMDRLDGFIIAAIVAALYGVSRMGLDNAALGLLRW